MPRCQDVIHNNQRHETLKNDFTAVVNARSPPERQVGERLPPAAAAHLRPVQRATGHVRRGDQRKGLHEGRTVIVCAVNCCR
jgi:hypothetical protein